ncbi:major capsid protein P2 [Microbulbifer sp. SAOS-129_SWC]|uniref:major capsid protein P2 n=1 Tax=Microbulbifer sp. SAOS-129_SWC TaxID=3145235 RepID=UPI0032180A76
MRIDLEMPSFEGVGKGQKGLIKMPIGRRYHSCDLTYSGCTLAEMEFTLKLNGKVFQTFSGAQRDALNQYFGLEAAAGVLHIPFDRQRLLQREQMESTAINTGVADKAGNIIKTFTLEVKVDSGAAGPVALSLDAEMSDPVAGGPGLIPYIHREDRSTAGAGWFTISDFDKNVPERLLLQRATFIPSTGQIDGAEVWRENRAEWQRNTTRNQRKQKNGKRVPQSGYWSIDTEELGFGGNTIPLSLVDQETGQVVQNGVQDFRIKLDASEAMNVTALLETIGVMGR